MVYETFGLDKADLAGIAERHLAGGTPVERLRIWSRPIAGAKKIKSGLARTGLVRYYSRSFFKRFTTWNT
ncbi:MAG: hypothetical protein B0D96_12905 [Candidatus Sedimenticola endophacoides]|uniref:Uncharacterized protein n=1 Tax=Candidatus Sedimenticola endophacoides TaxID=2548426 RepID=A0A657PPC2_9GAMM|nr:MAG: hypothetical protein B0D94_01910 [Candidatus Sedimenticola endophacoides]OQX32832.1 MAG: hypothetical protein B0D96_12905 [Candidatus Sedimenticola endophacoides]OQX40583.1 MAG: hypothetical protein B0D89_07350 [Candidatus Sedimenticola endophacoides]OQX43010.1 MAG: hypothetical protein B0D88_05520 [Candidatus Sedimenticola endophacoides]OQX49137.1 MAG: hypothetical protein B0D87_01950 [Candidatus Sedimenticola endophacoides]